MIPWRLHKHSGIWIASTYAESHDNWGRYFAPCYFVKIRITADFLHGVFPNDLTLDSPQLLTVVVCNYPYAVYNTYMSYSALMTLQTAMNIARLGYQSGLVSKRRLVAAGFTELPF